MDRHNRQKYDKEYRSYAERLEILKDRKLIISDDDRAIYILKSASYYDLINGYKECFTHTKEDKTKPDGKSEIFNANTSIEDLYN